MLLYFLVFLLFHATGRSVGVYEAVYNRGHNQCQIHRTADNNGPHWLTLFFCITNIAEYVMCKRIHLLCCKLMLTTQMVSMGCWVVPGLTLSLNHHLLWPSEREHMQENRDELLSYVDSSPLPVRSPCSFTRRRSVWLHHSSITKNFLLIFGLTALTFLSVGLDNLFLPFFCHFIPFHRNIFLFVVDCEKNNVFSFSFISLRKLGV